MKYSDIEGKAYSEILRSAEKMHNPWPQVKVTYVTDEFPNGLTEEEFTKYYGVEMKKAEEFHAKQQLADFTKAAMQGMIANPKFSEMEYDEIARWACGYARATIDEMIRRDKEDENT